MSDRSASPADDRPATGVDAGDEQATAPDGPAPRRPAATVPEARALTRARAHDLRTLIQKYVRRHLPGVPEAMKRSETPPRTVGAHARLLPLLRAVPWILGAGFAFSFVWDFPGTAVTVFSYVLTLDGLLRIITVSGLIGFFTNWLAITMLFNPRHKRPLLGQGLIPAQRERVIYRLARAVSDELINEQIIKQKIEESGVIARYREMAMEVTRGVVEDPDFRDELKLLTADYVQTVLASEEVQRRIVSFTIEKIEEYVGEGLGGVALKAYRFLGENDFKRRVEAAVSRLPRSLDLALDGIDHVLDQVPARIEARSGEIEAWVTKMVLSFVEQLDVYEMIAANMKRYDEQQLERLLKNTSNEQLNYIKYLGGVLGCIGGLVIWKPGPALALFVAVGLVLYAVDETLYRAREKGDESGEG